MKPRKDGKESRIKIEASLTWIKVLEREKFRLISLRSGATGALGGQYLDAQTASKDLRPSEIDMIAGESDKTELLDQTAFQYPGQHPCRE